MLLVTGLLLEAAFAIGLYRYWRAWMHYLVGLLFAVLGSVGMFALFAGEDSPSWVYVAAPLILVVGSLVFVWTARAIAAALARAGVGSSLARPVDRCKRVAPPKDAVGTGSSA